MSLYTDNKPGNTVKGLGFANAKVATASISKIKNRSIIYQQVTINGLLNRAKKHSNKTKDIEAAIKVFEKWLAKNKSKKIKYPYLPLAVIKKYEKLAEERGLSEVSRGKKKSNKSDYGILQMYKKHKTPRKLAFIPAKKSNPAANDYDSLREKFINARLGQMKKAKTKLFDKDGLPTNQHIVLIMNAYSPVSDLKKLSSCISS